MRGCDPQLRDHPARADPEESLPSSAVSFQGIPLAKPNRKPEGREPMDGNLRSQPPGAEKGGGRTGGASRRHPEHSLLGPLSGFVSSSVLLLSV